MGTKSPGPCGQRTQPSRGYANTCLAYQFWKRNPNRAEMIEPQLALPFSVAEPLRRMNRSEAPLSSSPCVASFAEQGRRVVVNADKHRFLISSFAYAAAMKTVWHSRPPRRVNPRLYELDMWQIYEQACQVGSGNNAARVIQPVLFAAGGQFRTPPRVSDSWLLPTVGGRTIMWHSRPRLWGIAQPRYSAGSGHGTRHRRKHCGSATPDKAQRFTAEGGCATLSPVTGRIFSSPSIL